jgi:hypothetical protein
MSEPVRDAALRAALAYYAGMGMQVREVRTDNRCERFVQSDLREYAYARVYSRSWHRRSELARCPTP